jgi:chorismate mutase / prephenate dehydratase
VVPVENSTEGVVTHTLDMFVDSDLKIVSQIVLPVQQCLMSNSPRAKIKKLYVHPQSLAQCRGWLQNICRAWKSSRPPPTRARRNWRRRKKFRRHRRRAGGGKIRPEMLEAGHPGQRRQRHALPRAGPPVQPAHRRRPHQPDVQRGTTKSGALHEAPRRLPPFKINMTKIESRPSKRKAWEYFFFIDCDGHAIKDRRSPNVGPSSMLGGIAIL